MLLQKILLGRKLTSSSSILPHMKVYSRAWSALSGSRYVSNPVDDKENASVISDLLVYEKQKQLKAGAKTKETKQEKKKVLRKSSKKVDNDNVPNLNVSDAQNDIINLMKVVKFKRSCYIIGQEAADVLVGHVKNDLQKGDIIAESNLGAGVLTKTILEQTNNRVIGYEPNQDFLKLLQSEFKDYPSRLELHALDLLSFYRYYTVIQREPYREEEEDRLGLLLQPLTVIGDERVRILASLSELSFIHNLTLSFTFQCCFFEKIFPTFYLYIPQHCHEQLMSQSHNMISRRLKIPFQFYFDIESLDAVNQRNFYSQYFKRPRYQKKENETLHLVKITPKDNVHEIVPKNELPSFHYFMRSMNTTKSGDSLIFHMERWIPGCGIDFIKHGFRMFTHPRQVPGEQLLDAYKLFTRLPSYEECMFHQFCKNWTIQFGLRDDEVILKTEDDGEASDKENEILQDIADDDEDFSESKR